MYSFEEDLKLGERAQTFIVKQLQKDFKIIKQSKGEFKDYDLLCDDVYKIEVKFDRLSKETNNVGIEYLCNSQQSGVSCTTANEWAHIYYLNGELVYSRALVSEMKEYLRNNWEYLNKVVGGDGNRAKLVLVPTALFAERFSFISIH